MSNDNQFQERRKDRRYPFKIPFPAWFTSNAGVLKASVDEISASGAKLRIKQAHSEIPFLVQGSFEYKFHTHLGQLLCKAKTAWVQRVGQDFVWGIEFIEIDKGSNDPLYTILHQLMREEDSVTGS